MAGNLLQCVIQNYTGPRTFDALQLPHGYVIKNVRLPNTISIQIKPLEKSIVFVTQTDDYQAYFVSVVRDPIGFLEDSNIGVQGSVNDDTLDPARSENELQQGEIYLEARGESKDIAGSGPTIYLANDGTINLHSGRRKESIIIGGTDDEDDGEIVITADNGFYESNVNDITKARSTVRFDEDNQIEIGNFRVLIPDVGLEEDITDIPIVTLVMEPDGELTMGNFSLVGINLNKLNMSPLGTTTLSTSSLLGVDLNELKMTFTGITTLTTFGFTGLELNELKMLPTGTTSLTTFNPLGIETNKLEMLPTGLTTLDATIINLNNGIKGSARLDDETTTKQSFDSGLFWQAWDAMLQVLLGSPINEPGLGSPSALQAAIIAKLGTAGVTLLNIPDQVKGKITSSSSSVLVGD